jgi:hypothetical protein
MSWVCSENIPVFVVSLEIPAGMDVIEEDRLPLSMKER